MKDDEKLKVVTLPNGNNIVVPEDFHGEIFYTDLPEESCTDES